MTEGEQATEKAQAYRVRMIDAGATGEEARVMMIAYYDGWMQSREELRPLVDKIRGLVGLE